MVTHSRDRGRGHEGCRQQRLQQLDTVQASWSIGADQLALLRDQSLELLARYHDAEWIDARLYETEIRNLRLFGYGVKGFTLSMIETAIEVSRARFPGGFAGAGPADFVVLSRDDDTLNLELLEQQFAPASDDRLRSDHGRNDGDDDKFLLGLVGFLSALPVLLLSPVVGVVVELAVRLHAAERVPVRAVVAELHAGNGTRVLGEDLPPAPGDAVGVAEAEAVGVEREPEQVEAGRRAGLARRRARCARCPRTRGRAPRWRAGTRRRSRRARPPSTARRRRRRRSGRNARPPRGRNARSAGRPRARAGALRARR